MLKVTDRPKISITYVRHLEKTDTLTILIATHNTLQVSTATVSMKLCCNCGIQPIRMTKISCFF